MNTLSVDHSWSIWSLLLLIYLLLITWSFLVILITSPFIILITWLYHVILIIIFIHFILFLDRFQLRSSFYSFYSFNLILIITFFILLLFYSFSYFMYFNHFISFICIKHSIFVVIKWIWLLNVFLFIFLLYQVHIII